MGATLYYLNLALRYNWVNRVRVSIYVATRISQFHVMQNLQMFKKYPLPFFFTRLPVYIMIMLRSLYRIKNRCNTSIRAIKNDGPFILIKKHFLYIVFCWKVNYKKFKNNGIIASLINIEHYRLPNSKSNIWTIKTLYNPPPNPQLNISILLIFMLFYNFTL